jgi:hypothetical protein
MVIAGNFNDTANPVSLKVGNKYLNVSLTSHSLNTFIQNEY